MWIITWIIAAAIGFVLAGPIGALAGIGVVCILGVVTGL